MSRSPVSAGPKSATAVAPKDPVRARELGAIHAAKKQLALTDDSYRGLISRLSKGRTESSAELTAKERHAVIEYFRSVGFTRTKSKTVLKTPAARREDFRPQAQKLKAMWWALWQLGVVQNADLTALDAFVKRHTGIEIVRWAYPDELRRAIECLKQWCARFDYDPKPCDLAGPQLGSFRPGLIIAQWERLRQLGALAGHNDLGGRSDMGLETWLRNLGFKGGRSEMLGPEMLGPEMLDDEDADEAIRRLGLWIRSLTAKDSAERGGGGD